MQRELQWRYKRSRGLLKRATNEAGDCLGALQTQQMIARDALSLAMHAVRDALLPYLLASLRSCFFSGRVSRGRGGYLAPPARRNKKKGFL